MAITSGLIEVFWWMGEWHPTDVGETTVEMNTDHDLATADATVLGELTAARERGDITRDTWWREAQRRDVLGEDFDGEAEAVQLDEAGPEGFLASDMRPADYYDKGEPDDDGDGDGDGEG